MVETVAVRNGGHVVAEVLARHGVRQVFGQDSPEWLYEALDPSQLRAVTMRDERSAGFAADAVARLTGRPAVACGIHGPGALNLTTALLEAQAACSPLVALISGVETTTFGGGAFQEADHVAIARPLVKWAVRVERPDRLEETVDRALAIATAGRPGPVLVELPNDVMEAPQAVRAHRGASQAAQPQRAARGAAVGDVVAAAELLAAAERPVVLAGNGARMAGASAALVALAERLDAPIAVTAMGRGAFPETHPLFAGVAGFMSDREDGSGAVANAVLRDADVLLVLGSALDGVTTDGGRLPGAGATIVRVDVDPEQPARSRRPELNVQGDAAVVARALLDVLPLHHRAGEAERPTGARDEYGALAAEAGPLRSAAGATLARRWEAVRAAQAERGASAATAPVAPARLFVELQAALRPEDLVVCDAAYSSVWALSYLQQGRHFDRIAYGRAAGTLGFGLPAAVGAAAAVPGRRVVALVGDGGFGFGWGELETLVRERLPVVCVVLNNGCYAYQKLWHDLNEGVSRGLDFAPVRHDELAAAVGARGFLVERAEQLAPALEAALDSGEPCVVDVRTDPDELPPFKPERHIGK